MAGHIISIVVLIFFFYIASPNLDVLFSWHPILMALSFGFLMPQAIMVLSKKVSLVRQAQRDTKIQLHAALQLGTVVCATAGIYVVYYNKEQHGRSHLVSWHSWSGAATWCYLLVQVLGGIAVKNNLLRTWLSAYRQRLYHATSGTMLTLLASATLVLAMFSDWYTQRVTDWSWRCALFMPGLLALVIVDQVTQAYVHNRPVSQVKQKVK